jgi:hypothetical protein
MSVSDLPEDLARWPDDPYELLGVRPGIAPRDLRRAYTQRIRTFKPEQFPEHFCRIRAAYETVLRHVEMFGLFHVLPTEAAAEESDDAEERDDGETETEAGPEASAGEALPMPQLAEPEAEPEEDAEAVADVPSYRGRDLHKELHEAWERACSGAEADAYARLRALHDSYPEEEDVYVRLYWLLAVAPEVDPLRAPADWLIAGLRVRGVVGPLRELLHRELEETPSLALDLGCTQLLQTRTRPALLLDFLEWRWHAAGRLEKWETIGVDLDALRGRFIAEEEESWARLLLLATDQLAWARAEKHRSRFRHCVHELEQLIHLHARLGDEMDRLDFLQILANAWHAQGERAENDLPLLRLLQLQLLRLIPLSWSRPFSDIHPLLDQFLATIVEQPAVALRGFDRVQEHAGAVLTQYGRALLQYQYAQNKNAPDDECSEALALLVAEFLEGSYCGRYDKFRVRLVDFCLREQVSPSAVAQLIESRQMHSLYQVAQSIHADWPLRYVFQSCWLYWA